MAKVKRTARPKQPKRRAKASTEDVVGKIDLKVPPKWRRQYRMLIALREHLRREKGLLVQNAVEEYTGIQREMADVATNSYDRDWALSMISSEQNALYEIEQALNRIRTGTYGKCEVTGKPIPMERLNAVPWTRFITEAERELEKSGQLERTKLGHRERVPQLGTGSNEPEER